MRRSDSKPKHVVVLLREFLRKKQPDFAELIGCSTATIQSVELGPKRLKLSDELAHRIVTATGVSLQWLLDNDLRAPMRDRFGEPYMVMTFDNLQARKQVPPPGQRRDVRGELLNFYCHLRAVVSEAQTKGNAELALYRVGTFLERLKKEFGYDRTVYDAGENVRRVRFGSRTLKRAKADVEAVADAKLARADVEAVTRDNAAFFNENGSVLPAASPEHIAKLKADVEAGKPLRLEVDFSPANSPPRGPTVASAPPAASAPATPKPRRAATGKRTKRA